MQQQPNQIVSVPTNIITGFLGVGKTSTILHLLKNKPSHERWAVLVNEFGEIGIDGAFMTAQHSEDQGIFIREIPGGCMCCTAGLPMQIALAQLIKRAKPDRLLIEPTGLGHPQEVLATLTSENFRDVLDIQKIATLIDARILADPRYTEHEAFKQQIAIADILIANKHDLYGTSDKALLEKFLIKHSIDVADLTFAERGIIDPNILEGPTARSPKITTQPHTHNNTTSEIYSYGEIPKCGYVKAENHGEGFASIGWRFASLFQFDRDKVFNFLMGVKAERMKAVFITGDGSFAYNLSHDALSEIPIESLDESKIEIISDEIDQKWEPELFDCSIDLSQPNNAGGQNQINHHS